MLVLIHISYHQIKFKKLDKIIEISKTSTKKILKNTSFDNLNTFIEDDEFFKTLLDERNDYFRDF